MTAKKLFQPLTFSSCVKLFNILFLFPLDVSKEEPEEEKEEEEEIAAAVEDKEEVS